MRQHHAPDQRRIIRLGNLSQGGQDRLDLLDVVVDSPGADVSGACEPGAEACEALPVRPEGATPRLDLPGVCEVVQKPWDVGSVAALVLGASAPADARYRAREAPMIEPLERAGIDITQTHPRQMQPGDECGRPVPEPVDPRLCVALPAQLVEEGRHTREIVLQLPRRRGSPGELQKPLEPHDPRG